MEITTKKNLIKHFKSDLKLKNDSIIWLHVGISGFGILENGLKTLYDAINEYFSKGIVIIPSFTYSWNEKNFFNKKTLCNEKLLGPFPNYLIKKKKCLRSNNPNFSVIIINNSNKKNLIKNLISSQNKSCFGKNSIFDLLYHNSKQNKSYILLLGGAHNDVEFRTTFIHYVEEKIGVPYRFIKKVYSPDKKKFLFQYCRYRNKNLKNDLIFPDNIKYKNLGKLLNKDKNYIKKIFKYSRSRMIPINYFSDFLYDKISKNKNFLLR